MEETLINYKGDKRIVEIRESNKLSQIGGFAMAYANLACITISDKLSDDDKDRGRAILRELLLEIPIGTKRTILWNPDD